MIAIVARFGAGLSFRELMADLLDLVDDHTEYFRSHLESLPAQERRVYLALATLWKPATTREIADQARLDTSTCSAQLTRLSERGAVQTAGGSPRRKQYYLTERLYNIYYLLRRRRGPDRLVEALIHFMESYYSPVELKAIGTGIARAVGSVDEYTQSLCQTGPPACESDIEATLTILPKLDGLPPECLSTLMALSVEIGSEHMLELIQASPSATLLLPLTAALEEDLGRQPRVAREIEEVAQDIHADLSALRAERTDDVGP